MKKFTFTLAFLQNAKIRQEKDLRIDLAAIDSELEEQVATLEAVEADMAAQVKSRQQRMVNGLQANELRQLSDSYTTLVDLRDVTAEKIRRISEARNAILERLVALMTELKGLEILYDRQYEEFKHEQARAMENEISEFVSSRHPQVSGLHG